MGSGGKTWLGFWLIDFGFSTFEAMYLVKFGFSRPGLGLVWVGQRVWVSVKADFQLIQMM